MSVEEQIAPGALWKKGLVNFTLVRIVGYDDAWNVVVQDVARIDEGTASYEAVPEHAFRATYTSLQVDPTNLAVSCIGHRPEAMATASVQLSTVRERVYNHFTCVLRGLQPAEVRIVGHRGCDQWFGWAAIAAGVPLVVQAPYEGFHSSWAPPDRAEFDALCGKAATVEFIYDLDANPSDGDAADALNGADRVFFNDAQLLVACWRGKRGRTGACVESAVKERIPYLIVNNPDLLVTP